MDGGGHQSNNRVVHAYEQNEVSQANQFGGRPGVCLIAIIETSTAAHLGLRTRSKWLYFAYLLDILCNVWADVGQLRGNMEPKFNYNPTRFQ